MAAKACSSCRQPLPAGLAVCPFCGARVGTVFSGKEVSEPAAGKRRSLRGSPSPLYDLERVRGRGNNSLILALASFLCPGIGFAFSAAAILMGLSARRSLLRLGVEEGRGAATAGMVIGAISLIAQVCYAVYFLKSGISF